jgi:hypothetical protein
MARAAVLILLAAICCVGSWLLGYREGQQTGAFHLLRQMGRSYTGDADHDMDLDREKVCNQIRSYKESIARDLDEHTQICGWPDMDGRENPN